MVAASAPAPAADDDQARPPPPRSPRAMAVAVAVPGVLMPVLVLLDAWPRGRTGPVVVSLQAPAIQSQDDDAHASAASWLVCVCWGVVGSKAVKSVIKGINLCPIIAPWGSQSAGGGRRPPMASMLGPELAHSGVDSVRMRASSRSPLQRSRVVGQRLRGTLPGRNAPSWSSCGPPECGPRILRHLASAACAIESVGASTNFSRNTLPTKGASLARRRSSRRSQSSPSCSMVHSAAAACDLFP